MDSSLPRATTDVTPINNNRRQLSTMLQQIRRQAMTEEQRHEYLSRRRTNYHQRRYDIAPDDSTMNVSNVAPNSIENATSRRRERQRILDRQRRNLMTNDERITYLARRRETYRRRNQHSMSSSREGFDEAMVQQPNSSTLPNSDLDVSNTVISESTHNISESCINTTTVRQSCRSETIPYHTLTSNFERGNASTHQRPTNDNFQGIDTTTVGQSCRSEAIPYHTLTSNFESGNASTHQRPTNDDSRGQILNFSKNFDDEDMKDILVVQMEAASRYPKKELLSSARLLRQQGCR